MAWQPARSTPQGVRTPGQGGRDIGRLGSGTRSTLALFRQVGVHFEQDFRSNHRRKPFANFPVRNDRTYRWRPGHTMEAACPMRVIAAMRRARVVRDISSRLVVAPGFDLFPQLYAGLLSRLNSHLEDKTRGARIHT
ncbi:hypothetical protein VTK26DRAFT_8167 [Humicola hyalothermophila]